MRTLDGVGMLLVDNARSRAYLEYTLRENLKPAWAVVLTIDGGRRFVGQRSEHTPEFESPVAGRAAGPKCEDSVLDLLLEAGHQRQSDDESCDADGNAED